MDKLENGLCGWNADLNEETGQGPEQGKIKERFTRSDHSRCFESIAPRMCGKAGKILVCDVLGHELPGGMAVLFCSYGSESGGCNVCVQVQADRYFVREKSWAHGGSNHSLHCDTRVCSRRLCRKLTQMLVLVLLQAAELSREIVVEQLDVKKGIRPRGPSWCFQGNEITKFEPILDSLHHCTLEWKLHESAFGDGNIEQSSDEPRFTPGCILSRAGKFGPDDLEVGLSVGRRWTKAL